MKTPTDAARVILEDALHLYLESLGEPDLVITGWVVTVSLASPEDEGDRYTQTRAPGMPYHSALGLLYKGVEMIRH